MKDETIEDLRKSFPDHCRHMGPAQSAGPAVVPAVAEPGDIHFE